MKKIHVSSKPSHYNEKAVDINSKTLKVASSKAKSVFKVADTCGIDGSKFVESKTERILMIAKKQK